MDCNDIRIRASLLQSCLNRMNPFFPALYPDGFDFDNPTVELPGTGCKLWDATQLKNAHDKIVTGTNTGKSDAYVRTWIALEDPFTVGGTAKSGKDGLITAEIEIIEVRSLVIS